VINEKILGTVAVELHQPQKLRDFRASVLTKLVRFWDDKKDIKISILETLSQFARRDDLKGWVRPSGEVNMPALTDEIARLSRENSDLRRQLLRANEMRASAETKALALEAADAEPRILKFLSENDTTSGHNVFQIGGPLKISPTVIDRALNLLEERDEVVRIKNKHPNFET